jgi:murein DD-endopeptidase MepM/ murein hydrolase activator NlpD
MLRLLACACILTGPLLAAIDLRLPTGNQHLFTGEPERFYMYVERTFEGQVSRPWEGGSFGFVRNPIRLGDQIVFTKFHEGIDISPLERDPAGNPLDRVASIADGRVVHISPLAGRSNYGKYVVVEHLWENSAYYSLYAHLAEISCQVGDAVKAGEPLGRMGFTGVGIDRARAHVHLELALLMSQHYEEWHMAGGNSTNYHGNYNGMNLTGFDVARFFVEHKANPELRVSEFIAAIPVYFKVAVPAKGPLDFVTRYPWIFHGEPEGARSWEISFSATGVPVAIAPGERQVDAPLITSVLPSTIPHRYLTRNLVTGQGNRASLTQSGKQLVALITGDFPVAKEPVPSSKP